jgi:cytochrome c-type biogenesis protein
MYEIFIAFAIGFASFLSPCILPIIPGFISSLAGTATPGEVTKTKRAVFISTLYFVLGFSLVFALLGTLIACFCTPNSPLGLELKNIISHVGGAVIIAFGIFLILTTKIPRLNFQYLMQEKLKLRSLSKRNLSYTLSWIFGATFAAGWTPCVGPLLGSILALAAMHPAVAYDSLLAYALGLGVPFLLIGAFFSQLTPFLVRIVIYTKWFDLVMGSVLIIVGIAFLAGLLGNV